MLFISVHITGFYNGKQFEDRDVKFVLGEGSEDGVILGIEHGLKKFKSGEKSNLRIKSNYAYGEKGHKEYDIPPGADLEYEVTLKTFEKVNKFCLICLRKFVMWDNEFNLGCYLKILLGTIYFTGGKPAIFKCVFL